MSTVAEIEAAISHLRPEELAELIEWLKEYDAEAWDRQIEADLDAGRLDETIAEAEREYRAGLSRPL